MNRSPSYEEKQRAAQLLEAQTQRRERFDAIGEECPDDDTWFDMCLRVVSDMCDRPGDEGAGYRQKIADRVENLAECIDTDELQAELENRDDHKPDTTTADIAETAHRLQGALDRGDPADIAYHLKRLRFDLLEAGAGPMAGYFA